MRWTSPLLAACFLLSDQRPITDDSREEIVTLARPAPPMTADEKLEAIMRTDPMRFLTMSLEKYDKEIQGYSLTFLKQEKIAGKMKPREKLECHFREAPFGVTMKWIEGKGLASKVLFASGENNDKMLARPFAAFLPIMTRDVDGPDAKNSGRFTIAQFGFKKSTERTLDRMKKSADLGKLHVRYEGRVHVPALNETCHKFVRFPYDPPEEDDLNELTLYFDMKHWLQVGSILKDSKGQRIAEYFFYDLILNPTHGKNEFRREGL